MKRHKMAFKNLVNAGTGEKPLTLAVPKSRKSKCEAVARRAGRAGSRAGRHVLEMIKSSEQK